MDDIPGWRRRIDEIDTQLLSLLNERAKCAIEIGKLKQHAGLNICDPNREREVISRMLKLNAGPLSGSAVRCLFECLIKESRQLEQED
jgi:chorismate mutase